MRVTSRRLIRPVGLEGLGARWERRPGLPVVRRAPRHHGDLLGATGSPSRRGKEGARWMPPPFLREMVLGVTHHPEMRPSSHTLTVPKEFPRGSFFRGGVGDAKVHPQNGLGSESLRRVWENPARGRYFPRIFLRLALLGPLALNPSAQAANSPSRPRYPLQPEKRSSFSTGLSSVD